MYLYLRKDVRRSGTSSLAKYSSSSVKLFGTRYALYVTVGNEIQIELLRDIFQF